MSGSIMEKMYEVENVRRLHIELSSKCNASCPGCSRNYAGGAVVEDLELTELTLDDIKRMVPIEIAKNLTYINFCGNLGDPGTANDLIPILEYFREHSPDVVQQVRTNGGMRNEKFWTDLGNFFKVQGHNMGTHIFGTASVVFSVDGLEDTNHIYRRGVVWNKLIRNMRAYSSTGAIAIWEFLLFEHNQHQVEEAQALADELGFKLVVKTPMGFGEYEDAPTGKSVYNKEGVYEYTIWPANYTGPRLGPPYGYKVDFANSKKVDKVVPLITDFARDLEQNSKISCRSIMEKNSKEIYISANGYMLPCCFLGGIFGQFDSSYSRYQFNKMITDYGLEVFDLKKQSMLEIIERPEFSQFFFSGWNTDKIENGKLLYCLETCGNKSAIDKLYGLKP